MVQRLRASLISIIALGYNPAGARAQLRPLDPLDSCVRTCDGIVVAEGGAAIYAGQRAGLAGLEGRLVELGEVRVLWRLDRVAFEAAGTVSRRFAGRRRFAEPVAGTGGRGLLRGDVGDFRLATIVTLAHNHDAGVLLRFGTRLPTTDDRIGLDRDRTDFFVLLGGVYSHGPLVLVAESGLGIYGTRGSHVDQVDLWLYSATLEYEHGALVPGIALVGQVDGRAGTPIRGNEDLGEARAGLRIGRRRWIRLIVVRGLTHFSPHVGVALALGGAF